MAKNIEKIYNDIFKLRDDLENLIDKSQEIASSSRDYPGIINNVLTEQIMKYFIPAIQDIKDNTSKPGSLAGIVKFLDAVPLAYTRDKEEISPIGPIIPENPSIEAPAGSSIVDEDLSTSSKEINAIPQNASYAKPEGDTINPVSQDSLETPLPVNTEEVRESLENKGCFVKRISKILDPLGEEKGKANKGIIVYEAKTTEEAQQKADFLNTTVLPEEKDLLGTEYVVCDKENN